MAYRGNDPTLYGKRNPVARLINKLKHFRKVATHYEITAGNALAAIPDHHCGEAVCLSD